MRESRLINRILFDYFIYLLVYSPRLDTEPNIQLLDIGNARVAGMERDLHLSSTQFEWLLRVFYISYIAFEWMTLLWKVFPPHVYRKNLQPHLSFWMMCNLLWTKCEGMLIEV